MTDEPLLDAVKAAFAGSAGPITLDQIYESAQAQIPELSESDRRQIRRILRQYRQWGIIEKTGQGRYETKPGVCRTGLFKPCDTSDAMYYYYAEFSIRDFIALRRREPFALREICASERLYDDAVRNRYVIRGFIEEFCREGKLERVGPRMYRTTASFDAELALKVPGTGGRFNAINYSSGPRRRPESRVIP